MEKRFSRYIVCVVFCIVFVSPSFAQKKHPQNNPTFDNQWFHLGFTLGYNNMYYRVTPSSDILFMNHADSVYGVEQVTQAGFNVGIVSDLKLLKHLNLRFLPGMNFGQRNLEYKMRNIEDYPDSMAFYTYVMKVPTIYIEAPVLLKFSGLRINNYRPYLVGGGAIRYDLEARRKNRKNEDYSVKINPLDYFLEVGGGVDFYLEYFKLTTEIKMCYGFKDIMKHEPTEYCTVIKELKSKMFVFSLYFE